MENKKYPIVKSRLSDKDVQLIITLNNTFADSSSSSFVGNSIVQNQVTLTPEQYAQVFEKLNDIYLILNPWRQPSNSNNGFLPSSPLT